MDEAPPFDPDLLLEHQDFVRGLAKSILFDDHRVDDVVQEAWLTALRRPPRQPAALRAWLATVVRNLARRNIRTQKRSLSGRASCARLSMSATVSRRKGMQLRETRTEGQWRRRSTRGSPLSRRGTRFSALIGSRVFCRRLVFICAVFPWMGSSVRVSGA